MKMYSVHSNVRSRDRSKRFASIEHRRKKQHIGPTQARLMVGRPLLLSEAQLMAMLDELKVKEAKGLLEVRTPDGRRVDLKTMTEAPAPVSPPAPHPPLDSAANDINGGEKMPQFRGGVPEVDLPQEEIEIPAEYIADGPTEVAEEPIEDIPVTRSSYRRGRRG